MLLRSEASPGSLVMDQIVSSGATLLPPDQSLTESCQPTIKNPGMYTWLENFFKTALAMASPLDRTRLPNRDSRRRRALERLEGIRVIPNWTEILPHAPDLPARTPPYVPVP